MYKVRNTNDLDVVYSILREQYPKKQIDVTYNYTTKEYILQLSDRPFVADPEVPIDLTVEVVYGDTDSIFVKFKYNRNDFEANRQDTFKLATLCGDKLTKEVFNRPPVEMEFEKVFQPFILLTKKRYVGKKFEDIKDPCKIKGIDAKGIALTRRDYCYLVKKCYKEIIDAMMNTTNKANAVDNSFSIIKKYVTDIECYNLLMDDVVVSAQVAKEYSCKGCKKKTEWIIKCAICKTPNPQKLEKCMKCKKDFACLHSFSLAHINLAQEMLKRNDEIHVGDRLSFAFIEKEHALKCLQKFDLAEDPKYIVAHNLKLNRVCYLEQLAKPILGFMKVILKDDFEKLEEIIAFVNSKLVLFGGKALRPSDFKIEE
jgi:DNA polymerase delta subunit 1